MDENIEKGESQDINELDAQNRLIEVMNDTPKVFTLSIGKIELKALKPAVQWLISEESVKIQKSEEGNFADLIKHYAQSIPSVVHVLTLAILNDKNKIFNDFDKREYSKEYYALYDKIMWETDPKEWMEVLVEVLGMLSLDFFFDTTNLLAMVREMTLKRKMTKKEKMEKMRELQDMSLVERNGDK